MWRDFPTLPGILGPMLLYMSRAIHDVDHHSPDGLLDRDDVGEGPLLIGHAVCGDREAARASNLDLLEHVSLLPLVGSIKQVTSQLLPTGRPVGGTSGSRQLYGLLEGGPVDVPEGDTRLVEEVGPGLIRLHKAQGDEPRIRATTTADPRPPPSHTRPPLRSTAHPFIMQHASTDLGIIGHGKCFRHL